MRQVWMALVLVTGCGAGGDQAGNATQAVQTASLTGLYEGGSPDRPNQMCVVNGRAGTQFGLVVWGANMHSCSGAGSITQDGTKLILSMAGDQSCKIEARIEKGAVTLPATVPPGCAYYCGAEAALGNASFIKKGGTAEDAMKAKDLVGEPLCEDLSVP